MRDFDIYFATYPWIIVNITIMGKRRNMTSEEIAQICALFKSNIATKEISELVGVGERSVQRIVKKFKEGGEDTMPEHATKSGRPRLLSCRDERVLRKLVEKNPRASAKNLKDENPQILASVSTRTVQRTRHDRLGYACRAARRKPLLTKRHRHNRLRFAKRLLNEYSNDKYKEILWSDEATFHVSVGKNGKVFRRKGSDPLDPKYVNFTTKHPDYVMVWGCFTYHGVGRLVFLPRNVTMNAQRYLELIVYEHLPDCMEQCHASVFMQDGAPCHTAHVVREWFEFCGVDFFRDWPGNSPDLNPIENLWGIIKAKLRNHDTSNLEKLRAAITDIWENFPHSQLQNLALSIPKRLKIAVKKRGGHTKY